MEKKDEKLLFTDICARTPYNVLVRNIKLNFDGYVMSPSRYQPLSVLTYDLSGGEDQGFSPIEDIRPYLRPMSSMTDEERKEYLLTWKDEPLMRQVKVPVTETDDWLEAHHFDYRGLIEKGLALEAPEGMYDDR